MKYVVILLFFGFNINAIAQVELKGYKLGQKTLNKGISTTVGQLNGNLIFEKLNDNRIFQINFLSRESDREKKINSNDIEIFKKSIEKFYDIELEPLSNNSTFGCIKNRIGYGYFFKINENNEIILLFTLTNLDLQKLSVEEKLSDDF